MQERATPHQSARSLAKEVLRRLGFKLVQRQAVGAGQQPEAALGDHGVRVALHVADRAWGAGRRGVRIAHVTEGLDRVCHGRCCTRRCCGETPRAVAAAGCAPW